MVSILHHYLDEIDQLKDQIGQDADNIILKSINIMDLINDPQDVINRITTEFTQRHIDSIKKGFKVSEKAVEKIIDKSDN
ncbi:MAG: hypothetical protein H8D94_01285 [Candidatus Pelagibacter sp.]|nr:hypothetical protein [Candidatus Pelagibacter sp.]